MNIVLHRVVVLVLALTVFSAWAVTFETPEQSDLYLELTSELRCVTCQNQSIADSASPAAETMKALVAEKIREGEPEAVIRDFFVERYGDYVTLKPSFKESTYLLWGLPALFFFLALFGLRAMIRPKS